MNPNNPSFRVESDIIAEIENAIEKAAIENSKMLKPQDNPLKMNQRDFIAGCEFILPLLKMALSQRDSEINFVGSILRANTDELKDLLNLEIVKLLGSEK